MLTKKELELKVAASKTLGKLKQKEDALRVRALDQHICPNCGDKLKHSRIRFAWILWECGDKLTCTNCGLEANQYDESRNSYSVDNRVDNYYGEN